MRKGNALASIFVLGGDLWVMTTALKIYWLLYSSSVSAAFHGAFRRVDSESHHHKSSSGTPVCA
jgi:hypothetical protein